MPPIEVINDTPEWLSESFYRDIISERDHLKGKSFELQVIESGSVVDVGENFCSQMFRVRVQCSWEDQKEESSFIIKSCTTNEEFIKEQDVFGTEFDMYRTVINAFSQMWEELGERVVFGPKCLKTVNGSTQIMVLSDLKEEGFAMLDRHQGMSEEATLLVLDRVAKFHASSVAYKERFGDFCPTISRKIVTNADMIASFSKTNIDRLAKAARHFQIDEKICEAVDKWNDGLLEDTKDSLDPDTAPNDFQVLCHGDLWLNNMMFQMDSATNMIQDVILIDFQLSYWNRPEADLFYFLCSSVSTPVLIRRFDYFVRFYHGKLTEALIKLEVKKTPPTLKDFHLQLLRNNHQVVRSFSGVMPVVLMQKSDAVTLADLMAPVKSPEMEQKLERAMFYNSCMEEKIKLLLPYFYDRGLLGTNFGNNKKGERQ